jgi:ComF family protein
MKVYALAQYAEPLQTLIRAKHWSNRTASYQLGELLWQRSSALCHMADYFVPIPLHWTRYAYRGFNQAEVITQVLSKYSGKPIAPLLKRIRKTLFQAQLPVDERASNVKNAFALINQDMNLYYNKHLVLIDDLMTTGATLQEAAKILLPLKPATISALVVCRVGCT